MSDLSPLPAERAELVRYEPWLETSLLWQTAKGLAEPTNNACPDALRGKTGAIFQQLLMGKELGLPPVQALTRLYVVKGKVGISATMMRALVRRAGHRISTLEKTDERCTLEGERARTAEAERVTWTLEDAERAGLRKDKEGAAWATYPRRMLFARATAELCDSLFPDVLVGFSYTPEELGAPPAEEDLIEAEGGDIE